LSVRTRRPGTRAMLRAGQSTVKPAAPTGLRVGLAAPPGHTRQGHPLPPARPPDPRKRTCRPARDAALPPVIPGFGERVPHSACPPAGPTGVRQEPACLLGLPSASAPCSANRAEPKGPTAPSGADRRHAPGTGTWCPNTAARSRRSRASPHHQAATGRPPPKVCCGCAACAGRVPPLPHNPAWRQAAVS
jgi:hypothetical protein